MSDPVGTLDRDEWLTQILALGDRDWDGTDFARNCVAAIRADAQSNLDRARSREIEFHQRALEIAAMPGHPNAQRVCAIALETRAIEFARFEDRLDYVERMARAYQETAKDLAEKLRKQQREAAEFRTACCNAAVRCGRCGRDLSVTEASS